MLCEMYSMYVPPHPISSVKVEYSLSSSGQQIERGRRYHDETVGG